MAFSYTCLTLQRAVIPVVLALSALYRPVGISFVYLLMFFISPFIPIATTRNFRGSVTPYLIILIALSTILLLCHIALQLTIIALKPDNLFGTCGFTEQLLRHVGFIDFRNINALAIVEWLAPEVFVFLTSLSTYLVIKKLTTVPSTDQLENGEVLAVIRNTDDDDDLPASLVEIPGRIDVLDEPPNFETLIKISPLFCLATLFFAAVLRPSVPGGFYFLIFLLSGSYWATFKRLERGFAILLRFVMIILVLHVICIVSYQTPWMQQNLDSRNLISRLISLEPLITSNCVKDIRIIVYDTTFKADSYLSPIVMLFSYYAIALTTKNLIKKSVSIRREQRSNATEPTETTPLVRNNTRKSTQQDDDKTSHTNIPLDELDDNSDSNGEDSGTSLCDQISYGIISVGGFIYQNSYIFTNILMMAWSIVYHSWLTFVLLLWANVLWMIPNQRKAMMRSSPFIVLYAELLLVAQYIYGMDLTNDELPSKVDTTGINLMQIGLDRPQEQGIQPCVPLIVKTSFLLMFWVTLRQFFKEKTEKQQSTGLTDIAGPIRVTIASTTVEDGQAADKKTSKILKKVGAIIKNLLVRLWVWLLVLVIFLCAITGKQMTGFRICYMALFLFFLLVFQSSSKAWLKIMYGFWLFLIFYAMSILILVYTYQFDKFDKYWSYYLNISKTLQTDIGLERFKTKDLFLQLVSPTIIVILTVIQVHYFHKRFIDSLQQARSPQGFPLQHIKSTISLNASIRGVPLDITTAAGEVAEDFEESIKDLIRRFFRKLKHQSTKFFKNLKNIFWRLLELHMLKLVYLTAFVCSIKEVCVLHISFICLCVLGTIAHSKLQVFFSRIISFIVTIIILTKMIYQVAYLDHNHYNVECPNLNTSHGSNNAVWFGLQKASEETGGLIGLLRRYIVYMVMVTLHAVVTLRQYQMRSMLRTQNDPIPKVLFPKINRADAEKNLRNMLKYLLNYGFYKFGYEIALIALAVTITYRGDVVAVIYVCWLAVLLIFERKRSRNIWSIFQIFIATSILLQYILFVGLPPSLCLEYPWENIIYSESIQIWALLPGGLRINHAQKLVFDYILLMIVNRQKRVFNVETYFASKNEVYPGGSNKSVLADIANMGIGTFENPTRDFLSNIRNYLDVFQNGILCGFYWVTLAVVFLAGTNISDVLALGYLVGAFVFLWQGSDFYLRPINVILRRWHWLIIYNVSNIVIKTCLQMTGCLFMQQLTDKCCWLVHLLGITCAGRVAMLAEPNDELFATNECPAIKTQVVLVWDTLCFAFLIFQLRIFKSHYFCHIINDTKANTILASRGADIIEDLRQKQIEHRQQHEQEVLQKIKRKMEKIRATQQKMLRPIDKPTHYDEHGYPIPGTRVQKRKEIKLHPQAVRAGDYYMFEDMDEKFELDLIEDEVDYLDDKVVGSEKRMTRRRTLIDGPDDQKSKDMTPTTSKQAAAAASTSAAGARSSQRREPPPPPSTIPSHEEEPEPRESRDDDIENSDDTPSPIQSKQKLEAKKSDDSKKKSDTDSTDATGKDSKTRDDDSSDDDLDANPIYRLLEAFLVSLTIRLNRFSRNYRYVNKILIEEKRLLKESKAFQRISHATSAQMFSVMKSKLSLENLTANGDDDDDANNDDAAAASVKSSPLKALNSTNLNKHNTNNNNNNSNNVPTTSTPTITTHETPQTSPPPPPSPPQSSSSHVQPQSHDSPEHLVDIIEMPDVDTVDSRRHSTTEHDGERSIRSAKGHVPEIRVLVPSATGSPGGSLSLSKHLAREKDGTGGSTRDFNFEEDFTSREHNIIVEVLIASWYAILSNTDLICYIVVFVNQVINASIISLPLPIMVFLWGTLSLPRPTKTFWVTLIAYTQAIVLIKCIFQYKLIWANYINLPNQPLSPAKIFGVELTPNYASYDLLLLLVLFLHRFILKSQGLWKSEYNREFISKTLGTRTRYSSVDDHINTYEPNLIKASVGIQEDTQHPPSSLGEHDVRRSQSIRSSETAEYLQRIHKLKRGKYLSSLRKFFYNLVKKTRLPTDVYALMFLCDFVNFFVMLFGFTAFGSQQNDGKSSGGVQTYLAENKVPIPFLIMLLVQFILIVIDRALYLRKALVYKIVFHFFSVIGIHIWMFFVVPAVTERSFYSLAPPIIFYIIKCFYLLLSSYQIKCGYPQRILGNFLTKGFSLANMISFKLYMQIPFLYELRTILDWVSTDTTMTLFDWLKMEDIFAHIYFIKCSRQMETDFPAVRATKKALYVKLLMGGSMILVLVIAIWGPLCLFALGNAVGTSNVPYEIATTIRIGPYDPIYSTNNRESIYTFDKPMYAQMQNAYMKDRSAITFLASYDASDIAAIGLAGNSPSLWSISPPDKLRLLSDLRNNVTLIARFSYSFTRIPHAKNAVGTSHAEVKYKLNESFTGREAMIRMIEGQSTEELVVLPALLPKFIKVLNSGELTIVADLMPINEEYRPLVIKMKTDEISKEIWWEIREFCNDTFHTNTLSKLPLSNCNSGIVMYTFNDKKFPSTFSFLTAGGIIGLYTTFVFVMSRFIKSILSDQHRKVMFEDLPYVDRVLQLCLDIYLVREACEFALEEDLFAKLIFLYRSPETMIKWTRPKEEAADDETDTESVRSRAIMRREHQ